jgi:hypothetical protein
MGGTRWLAAVAGTLCLCGCWTAPSTVLRTHLPPGPLATLKVFTDVSAARVEAVDCGGRKVTLGRLEALGTYGIGQGVKYWQRLHPGDQVDARIHLELSVYIPPTAGDSPPPAARVLTVDPSYRLLTLHYASGGSDTFKVDLRTPVARVMPGAWVDLHPREVSSLDVPRERRSAGAADACALGGTGAPS